MKLKTEIDLWAQSLHAVNKLGQGTVSNYTFSLHLYQYQKLLLCHAQLYIQY